MNSYVNTAVGALLGTIFVLMSVSIASEGIFHSEAPEKEGFAIVAEEAPAAGGESAPAAVAVPIAQLLASADAKAVNFASNLASLAVFAARGVVLWRVALPMAAAQAAGAWLGAHVTLRGGEKVVRPAVLLIVVALVAKLLHDLGA